MRAAVFRSFSRPYADRESHANPYVTNNLPLGASQSLFRHRSATLKEPKQNDRKEFCEFQV
jgi:hypothetical protein